ncbi:hypothetical protein BY996DRAFT_7645507 [Phakopsora pachyrhizi]|nr:hypothetical protein BY996DRAFT_7645507 [Phakopsora pachyrhizi]
MLFVSLMCYLWGLILEACLMRGYLLCSSHDYRYHYDAECFLFLLPSPQKCCFENNQHYQMGFHLSLVSFHQYVHQPL